MDHLNYIAQIKSLGMILHVGPNFRDHIAQIKSSRKVLHIWSNFKNHLCYCSKDIIASVQILLVTKISKFIYVGNIKRVDRLAICRKRNWRWDFFFLLNDSWWSALPRNATCCRTRWGPFIGFNNWWNANINPESNALALKMPTNVGFYIPYVVFKRSCVCLGLPRQCSEGEINVGDRRWTTRARGETKLWKTKGKRWLQRRQKRVRWFYGVNTIIIESGNEGKIAFFGWAHLAMLPMWTIQSGDAKCVDHHREQKVPSSLWPQSI